MTPQLLTLLLLVPILQLTQQCTFPQFLQNGTAVEWHSHITYHSRRTLKHYSLAAFFRGNRMRVLTYGGEKARNRPKSHTCECIMQYSETKYLATHTEDGNITRYICMEFLQRSPYVFQLNRSQIGDIRDFNMCHDMKLDYWVFVNKNNIYHSYTKCPLHGGFNMKMYDNEIGADVCNAYSGETRMEIECISGEGVTFLFRHANCVPDHLHMHRRQTTYCIGSWKQGRNMFVVLRHDKTDHAWCLRYPAHHTGSFTAYLFKNLYCDGADLPQTKDHLTIDMTSDTPTGLTNICRDDYEACSYWSKPCNIAGSVMQLTCAKMCGICVDSSKLRRPEHCDIPTRFRGQWHIKDDQNVVIDGTSVQLAGYLDLQCVDWENRHFSNDAEYIEQMFVSTFDNGCRPRYYCIQLKKHSHSVLRFKISQGQLWPFEGTNGITVDCGGFQYKDTHDVFSNNYHSQYFKTLTSNLDTVYVDCQLGPEKKFEVIFEDNVKCKGSLSQDGLSTVTKMKLRLDKSCPGRQTEQEFACLDSTKHVYFSQQLIVTETLDHMSARIKCWLFPTFPEDMFYLLSLEDCHEGAHAKVNSAWIRPLAKFQIMNDIRVSIVAIDKKPNRITSTTRKDHGTQNSLDSREPTYTNEIKSRAVNDPNKGESTPGKENSPGVVFYEPENGSHKTCPYLNNILYMMCVIFFIFK